MVRRYDPVAVDLFGVQNLHATCGSPSRFLLHALKLVILELRSKPATENEAEPIKWIFPSIMALIKSLIFLKTHSHAKRLCFTLGAA